MANYNLTNQEIKDTFKQLAQVSSSLTLGDLGLETQNFILDGTGSLKTTLQVSSSYAYSSSRALVANNAISATNADTASFFGEGIVTASSVASTITFTKDNGTTFDITVAQSGSVESASYANFASNAESASYATSASAAIYSVSSSYSIKSGLADNATNATTSSHAVSALSASYAISASHSEEADHAALADDLVINVKNLSGETLAKGTAVHATGVTGENVTVIKADASIAGNMPAVALLNEQLADNATGQAIIGGRLIGVDTSALAAGESVYVGIEGALTSTKPTGSLLIQNIGTAAKINASDGEIIIQGAGRSNDLPNLTAGYAWVGDSNGVPQAVTTSSFANVASALTASYVNPLNQDVTVNGIISASGDISGSRIAAANGFTTSQASNFGAIGTLSQTIVGTATIDMSNSVFSGLTIGSAALPTRAPGITMYTSHSAFAAGFNYAGITINDGDNNTTFYGNKVNAGGSGAVAPADKAAFVIQAGVTADSTTGDNTTFAINNDNGLPTFTKTLRTLKNISGSGGVSAAGGFTGSLNGDVVSTGTSTFNDISVTGTGSFAYIESVTGSAKIVGESFIVLQNDTPALRYAGIKVYDSGSSAATASLEWDGLSDNWIIAEESGNTGVVLTGVTGSRGSEALPTINSLQKGAGHHSLTNSNITDDGSSVGIDSDTNITGSVGIDGAVIGTGTIQVDNATGFRIGTNTDPQQYASSINYFDSQKYTGNLYASYQLVDAASGSATDHFDAQIEVSTFTSLDGSNPVFRIKGGGDNGTKDNTIVWTSLAKPYAHFTKQSVFESPLTASAVLSASAGIIGDVTGTASSATSASFATQANSASYVNPLVQDVDVTGGIDLSGTVVSTNSTGFTVGSSTSANQFASSINYYDDQAFTGNHYSAFQLVNNASGSDKFATQMEVTAYSGLDGSAPVFRINGGGNNGATGNTILWSSLNKPQAHFSKESKFLRRTYGSVVSQSIATGVTSSIDTSLGNFYTETLVSGSALHISASNLEPGQTFMLKTIQPGTGYGTITFSPVFNFAGGTAPTATEAANAIDVYTFVAFDQSNVYTTQLANMS